MKLHHTVQGTLSRKHADSIEFTGLIPQMANEYKDLVPEKIRHLPVVWLTEGIWQSKELPVFEVDSGDLDEERLFLLTDLAVIDVRWWVYQGSIPRNVLIRLA